mmetsp:Transcript_263/g.634  ORF Transcript_263/g.634 Transcript_263/m.634 type:complete len:247 (+) Transcript_263:42-782(+)
MVVRVESSDSSQPPLAASASSSLSSEDDLEGGSSSQDENETDIVSKFLPTQAGRPARRRSQCEKLSFRQRSELTVDDSVPTPQNHNLVPRAPLSEPAPFRRSSAMTSKSGNLPKCIQFYPSINEQPSSLHTKKLWLLAFLLVIISGAFMLLQFSQLTSLRQELLISNQHRDYMERSQATLLRQLHEREQSLDQYRQTHERMTRVNKDMTESMSKLRNDYLASAKEIERLRAVERRARSNSSDGGWD